MSYFAAPQNQDLGIVKPRRKPAREVDYCSLSSINPNIFTVFLRAIVRNSRDHWLSALTCHPCRAMHRIWTVARKEEEFLAVRVAMPRHVRSQIRLPQPGLVQQIYAYPLIKID